MPRPRCGCWKLQNVQCLECSGKHELRSHGINPDAASTEYTDPEYSLEVCVSPRRDRTPADTRPRGG
ncbi:MAG: hypothetical protein BWY19_00393 [bacterium ADurb.Bin212]|nr:MAG: hypothetical protein BWY19_00393 [bacterium ADurb.Bin212]